MPLNYMSPYQDAAMAAMGAGNAFSDVAASIARMRYEQALREEQMRQQWAMHQDEMALRQKQLENEKAYKDAMVPYYQAGAEQHRAGAAFEQERTRKSKESSNVADLLGSTLWQREMYERNPQYVTPEMRAINASRLAQYQSQLAGLDPTSFTAMVRPIEANQGANIINPLTERLIGMGQPKPEPGFNLGPGDVHYGPTGNIIAQSPYPARDITSQLPSLYSSMLNYQRETDVTPPLYNDVIATLQNSFPTFKPQVATNPPPEMPVRPPLILAPQPLSPQGETNAPMALPPNPAVTNAPPSGTNAPSTQLAPNETERVTKDGRKAIFDKTTKKFLRYAE